MSYAIQKRASPHRVLAYDCTCSFTHDLVQKQRSDWLRYVLKSCSLKLTTSLTAQKYQYCMNDKLTVHMFTVIKSLSNASRFCPCGTTFVGVGITKQLVALQHACIQITYSNRLIYVASLPAPASNLPTVKLRWRRGEDSASSRHIHSLVIDGTASARTKPSERSRHEFEKESLRDTRRLSLGLLAESTRTPSNKSSAALTEVRHCITYNWPETTIHRETSGSHDDRSPRNTWK